MTQSNETRPAWWPTPTDKLHADAGCAHPDECKVTPSDPRCANATAHPPHRWGQWQCRGLAPSWRDDAGVSR